MRISLDMQLKIEWTIWRQVAKVLKYIRIFKWYIFRLLNRLIRVSQNMNFIYKCTVLENRPCFATLLLNFKNKAFTYPVKYVHYFVPPLKQKRSEVKLRTVVFFIIYLFIYDFHSCLFWFWVFVLILYMCKLRVGQIDWARIQIWILPIYTSWRVNHHKQMVFCHKINVN